MKKFPILFILLFSLSSCVREVILDAGERTVVVDCVLTDSLTQTLKLSFTKGASQVVPTPLTDAEAILIDLTDSVSVGNFVKAVDGLWTIDHIALPNHRYRLEVKVPGYDLIFAEQTMPDAKMYYVHNNFSFYFDSSGGCQEQLGVLYFPISQNKLWVYGEVYDKASGINTVIDYLATDRDEYADKFNISGSRYVSQSSEVNYKGKKVHGCLYPMQDGVDFHKRYLRIPSCDFKEEARENILYLNEISFVPDGIDVKSNDIFMVFSYVSEEYDHYLKDYISYMDNKESSDLTSIYQRDDMYTNIEGGTGIFGAKLVFKGVWKADYTPHTYEKNYTYGHPLPEELLPFHKKNQ